MAWMEKLMMQVALVDQVTKPLAGINAQMDKVSKAGRQGWSSMAMGATTVAAGGMAIQSALGPAIEMDRALGEVASLDVQKDVLGALGREALALSVKYGESATEIVRSSYDIQSAIAGLEGNELPAFTRASTTLAKATKADTATITNYMGTMYGIFEQQAKMMGKANWVEDLAGKTATAVQMFKTTGQGMADAFQGVQSTATSLGVSMDEQFAVLGMLQSSMGGAVAGTAYKSFLSAIPKAGKGLGLSFYDATGAMLPMVEILDQIKGKFGETLDGIDIGKIQAAFGETATPVILNLLEKTDQLKGNINALANTHGMGKAEQMAAAMTDQWQRVEQAWFAIRAAAFGVVLPAINAVVGAFADGANDVLRWTHLFPNLTKLISYAALAIVGLSMVTGTWMLVAGVAKLATLGLGIAWSIIIAPLNLLKAGLVSFRAIMLAVNIAMYANPIGLIVAGIVLLIGAVAAVIYYWDDLKKTFSDWGVFQLLGKSIDWLIDKLNMIPGVNIEAGSMPDLNLPNPANINAPLARYREGGNGSGIPSGGLGQQLIQANAAATSANQKPAKALSIGEVHNYFQNPMTPEQMAENAWVETP